jgi:DNA invertase Pin-like site-specific DNA recombinase
VVVLNNKKIALYARVSKRIGQTVENQVPILEQWAKDRGFAYQTYTEEESTRNFRPVRQEIIALLRNKQIDGVACVRLDRFLRSLSEVILLKELIDNGSDFYFIHQGLELTKDKKNAMSDMQLGILAVFAEFERELIRERTFEGLDRAKSQGKQLGRRTGSKDKKVRRKSGYLLRWAGKKSPLVKTQVLSEETNPNKQSDVCLTEARMKK